MGKYYDQLRNQKDEYDNYYNNHSWNKKQKHDKSHVLQSSPGSTRPIGEELPNSQRNNLEQTNNRMDEMIQQSADRLYRIPVFLSRPNILNAVQEAFMRRLIVEIRNELLFPRTLPRNEQYPETVLENIRRVINSSYGLIATELKQLEVDVLGTNTGRFPTPIREWLGSEFLQIEPSMAYQRGLPLLLIRERGVTGTGIWNPGIAPFLIFLEWDPAQPLNEFFNSNQWKEVLKNWTYQVRSGYYKQTEPKFKY